MGDEDKICLYDHGCHGQPWLKMLVIAHSVGPALTEWMLSRCHSIDWFPVLPSTSIPGSCPFGISFHPYLHVFAENYCDHNLGLITWTPSKMDIILYSWQTECLQRKCNLRIQCWPSICQRRLELQLQNAFTYYCFHGWRSLVVNYVMRVLCDKLPSGSYVWRSNPKSAQKRKPPVSVLCEALLSMLQCQLQQPSFVCY